MGDGNGRTSVRVELLGPLRLVVDGAAVDVRGPKRRAVLALLALAGGRAVPVDHLLDALWPAELPDSGRQALHSHVSRLRGHLGAAAPRLETLDGGYRLVLGPGELDVAHARALLARSRSDTDPAAAHALLAEAHGLWRGPLLADLADVPPVANALVELEQLRREVGDALVAAAVAAGRAGDVAGVAAAALAEDPLREPAVLAAMRVQAATGRAADALATARAFRHRLAEEAGLDPSPALGALEREIAGGAAVARPAPSRPGTRLIGREGQVAALHRLLGTERLVTLVGPGGVGKTRVALEVAQRAGGTVLLLAPVTDPASVPHALAAALDLQVVQGDVLAACAAVLGAGPALLVLDNCEHLLDAVRDAVVALLGACPDLTVLATSREPLGLPVERPSRLAPLPVPAGGTAEPDAVRRVASVAVFLDRAARVRPGFAPGPGELALVAAIVARLDGMPLAIELAAGRLATFSLADLHDRLDRSLDLLAGAGPSADARHRTLRATVEWSWALLADDERALFRALSVFADGVDLATAEAVATDLGLAGDPAGVLARLVDASVVEADLAGGPRYRMLETLRAFGLDRLDAAGERDAAEARLLAWAVRTTAWIDVASATEAEPAADAALRRERGTLRAAWRLARTRGDLDTAAALVVALYEIGSWRDLTETWSWAEELAADPALPGCAAAGAVLGAAAEIAYLRGDYARAEALARDGLARANDPTGTRICRNSLAVAALSRGAFAEVVEHALAAAGPGDRAATPLAVAALAATYAGDLDRARALHVRAAGAAGSPTQRGFAAYTAGEIDNAAAAPGRGERHYRRAVEEARGAGATFLAGLASVGLVTALSAVGRTDEALRGYREVVDYFARTGNWTHLWVALRNLAVLLRERGDGARADVLEAAAARAPDAPAAPGTPPASPSGVPGRAEVLDAARRAIDDQLAPARA